MSLKEISEEAISASGVAETPLVDMKEASLQVGITH